MKIAEQYKELDLEIKRLEAIKKGLRIQILDLMGKKNTKILRCDDRHFGVVKSTAEKRIISPEEIEGEISREQFLSVLSVKNGQLKKILGERIKDFGQVKTEDKLCVESI